MCVLVCQHRSIVDIPIGHKNVWLPIWEQINDPICAIGVSLQCCRYDRLARLLWLHRGDYRGQTEIVVARRQIERRTEEAEDEKNDQKHQNDCEPPSPATPAAVVSQHPRTMHCELSCENLRMKAEEASQSSCFCRFQTISLQIGADFEQPSKEVRLELTQCTRGMWTSSRRITRVSYSC